MWRTTAITLPTAVLLAAGAAIRSVPAPPGETFAPQKIQAATVSNEEAPRATIPVAAVNVGEIPAGQPVLHEFVVTNSGTSRLEIQARPRCGCTVVDYAKSLEPGQDSRIKLTVQTRRFRGAFEKFVDVETNDPTQPAIRLTVAGRAIPAVDVQPSQNPVVQIQADAPAVLDLTLKTVDSVVVTGAQVDVPYAQTSLTSLEPGRYALRVAFQDEAPRGRTSLTLVLTTAAEYQPQVPLTVYLEKGIIVSPPALKLVVDRHAPEDTSRGSVLLRTAGRAMQVLEAVSPDESLVVEVSAVKEGLLYRLTATCRGEPAAWDGPRAITVKTDDPDQPLITVPVRRSSYRSTRTAGR